MIVVAGETLIDRVVQPDGTTSDHPGGGPFNSARTIGRLGRPVCLISVLGSDPAGDECLTGLIESGVDTSLVQRSPLSTTLAIATLNEAGAASYVFDFETSAARHLERVDLPADTTFFHVGTLALVLEPFATAVEAAIESLGDDVVMLVDPNCRPSVVRDAATFVQHVRTAIGRADIVKLSDDDLDYLRTVDPDFPGPAELVAHGTACVLYTRGGAGVEVFGPWGSTLVAAPRVTVADTVGAGDSLSGAFVAWLDAHTCDRDSVRDEAVVVEATEYAVRVAAITVSRHGAEPPTAAELAAFDFAS